MAYIIVSVCVLILRYQPGTVGLARQPTSADERSSTPVDRRTMSREDSPLLPVLNGLSTPSERTAVLARFAIFVSSLSSVGLEAMIIWSSHDILQAKCQWAIITITLMGLPWIGSIAVLLWLPQNRSPLLFKVPCVPVLPLLSIFLNLLLVLNLSYLTWVRFAIWMVIGESTFHYKVNNI